MKKIKSLILVLLSLLLLLLLSGCSQANKTTEKKPIKLPSKVVIGVVNSKALPPQAVYGFEKGIYTKEFSDVDFKLILSEGHHFVAEKMEQSAWDFAYLGIGPDIEFTNYGYDKWKPAKYTIIAGAQSGGSILMAKPEITNVGDLKGKIVGITNKNHDKEMVLNKLLAKVGLKTEALGGEVKVKYGEPAQLFKEYQKGTIQAFYPMPSMVDSIKKGGSKVLSDGSDTEFKKEQTATVFAVSNSFLEKYPEFVKEMVRVHVDNTILAENFNEMVELTYSMEKNYFKDNPKLVLAKPEIASLYKRNKTTYDPKINYLKDSYQFLQDAKYLKAIPAFEKWADFTMLNEVLKEKGLKPILRG